MIVTSAPGKVLLLGGYLVLDPNHRGLVLTTSSRIYCRIKKLPHYGIITRKTIIVKVNSPQFEEANLEYEGIIKNGSFVLNKVSDSFGENVYVESAISATLDYLNTQSSEYFVKVLPGISVELFADKDFYSVDLVQNPGTKFPSFGQKLHQVPKSGLGSSAALIVSIISAFLLYVDLVDLKTQEGLALVQFIATLAHHKAQGSIGSGFDISAAVWGSQIFNKKSTPDFPSYYISYVVTYTCNLNREIQAPEIFTLPPGLALYLLDVKSGSHTPSMVRKVMTWRQVNPEKSRKILSSLAENNELIISYFQRLGQLSSLNPISYGEAMNWCADSNWLQWDILSMEDEVILALYNIAKTCKNVRQGLSTLGKEADVPIEPTEQKDLLNEVHLLPGVVMAGIPGAGGYDAIFCVAIQKENISALRDYIASYSKNSLRLLDTFASSQGLRQDDEEACEN